MQRGTGNQTRKDLSGRVLGKNTHFCEPENIGHSCSVRQVICTVNDISGLLQRLKNLSTEYGSHIILFNEEMMAGKAHVDRALYHAFRAAGSGSCISSSVEIEALLYAAGSRQVVDGAKFGIHQGVNRAYLCLCPDSEEIWRILSDEMTVSADDWEKIDTNKKSRLMAAFNVTEKELAVIGDDRLRDLVIERVALLEVYK